METPTGPAASGASTSQSWETSQSELQSDPETQTETASDHETPKSHKIVRRPKQWKKNKRIRLRNTGQKYTSAPGKQVILLPCLHFMHINNNNLFHTIG